MGHSFRSGGIPLLTFLLFCLCLSAQNRQAKSFRIVFYNVENLFDPFDDPATNDDEYTPAGKCHWTMAKLDRKIMMVYRALMAASNGQYPDIVGLAEIENLWTIEYLLKNTPLKKGGYGIIHKESPDPRGIDVALLYRKSTVVPVDCNFIPVRGSGRNSFSSRDILHFKAKLNQETVHFFVNHWPSRSGGYNETRGKRDIAARVARRAIDSLLADAPHGKLLLMGDFNATPDEACFSKILRASLQPHPNPSELCNLSQFWLKNKTGTIRTKGRWEIFDQFICSYNLLNNSGLHISIPSTSICTADFLLEEETKYLGKKPFRTYQGPIYHGGVSDHLPVTTLLEKVN